MDKSNVKQLFIVGVGRSGTSLLQSMLNAHREICFTPEINYIRRFLATGVLEKIWQRNKDELFELLAADEFLQRLKLSREDLLNAVNPTAPSFSSRDLYSALQQKYAQAQGKTNAKWLGDKDPRSIEYLPLLARAFPGIHILHIMRDPRDVLSSKKKAQWSKDQPPLRHIFANRVQLRMGRQAGRNLLGPQYMELVYEELIGNAPAVLKRICAFLQIEYDPTMLDFAESSQGLVSASEMDWKKETLGPLLSKNAGKWKKGLTPWEVALTERTCTEVFRLVGYQKSGRETKLNPWQTLALWPVSLLLVLGDPVYRMCRWLGIIK